jgi:hypothetical protein
LARSASLQVHSPPEPLPARTRIITDRATVTARATIMDRGLTPITAGLTIGTATGNTSPGNRKARSIASGLFVFAVTALESSPEDQNDGRSK